MFNENLINDISIIKTFKLNEIDIILSEIIRANILWKEEYNEYQSGGWSTAALYNISGDPNDVLIQDGIGIPTTTITRQMPFTQNFIDKLDFKIMYARVARLSANSFLWEHVDYAELNKQKKYRLHIPLVTNPSSLLVIAGQTISLKTGYMWLLEPVKPHGVCNLYGPDRVHLIIDCYESDSLGELINQKQPSQIKMEQLPILEQPVLEEALNCSNKLFELGFFKEAENNLLQLFFKYSMPTGMPYDLIVNLYETHNRQTEASNWKDKKKTMLNT